jgi:hypothetical protein
VRERFLHRHQQARPGIETWNEDEVCARGRHGSWILALKRLPMDGKSRAMG